MKTLSIDLVSDVVCPWCVIGLARLRLAEAQLTDIAVRLRWRAFVLNPDLPPEGRDMTAHLAAKYGRTPEAVRASQHEIIAEARALGLNFDQAAQRRSWNTFDTHRVVHYAREFGCDEAFNEALFDAYFRRAANPTDPALLRDIGVSLGMPGDEISAILDSDRYADAVSAEIAHYRGLGVSAVPSFVVDGRYLLSGAQPPEVFAEALGRIGAAVA